MTEKTTNQPDLELFYEIEINKGRTTKRKIGVLWNHKKGDGVNIYLESLPVGFDGKIVGFPPKPKFHWVDEHDPHGLIRVLLPGECEIVDGVEYCARPEE